MDDDDDPLTPEERERVDAVTEWLLDEDRVFVCGICHNLVDARLVEQHAAWHDSL